MESFTNWKRAFDKGIAEKRAREDDEKMKNMTPKEREEWKRAATRLTGFFREFFSMCHILTQPRSSAFRT